MTASWQTLLDVALRTSIVYLALLVGLRLTGTRQLGQMSTFDLVLLLIIANAVQNAMVGPDRKSTRLNSSHSQISYAVFCLKKKNIISIISYPGYLYCYHLRTISHGRNLPRRMLSA